MIDDDFSNESASITATFLRSIQDWNLVRNPSIDSRSEKTECTFNYFLRDAGYFRRMFPSNIGIIYKGERPYPKTISRVSTRSLPLEEVIGHGRNTKTASHIAERQTDRGGPRSPLERLRSNECVLP